MKTYQCTEDRFLKDAGSHAMTVIRDDGIHRHLEFRKPSPAGSEYWFQLITYPGELVITGDMGTYVFRRLEDMFEFFRINRKDWSFNKDGLSINPSYWSEKLQATPAKGFEEFSGESFRTNVKEAFDNWVESNKPYADDDCEDCTKEQREAFDEAKAKLWESLSDDVLLCTKDGDVRAFDAASDFQWKEADWRFSLEDCWEWHCNEYTFHFIWCCYAIAWGIKTYDESKTTNQATTEAESAVTA
jgi:hypothetical protein